MDPAEKRLALEVEDHDPAYGDFEGIIPEGEYGAGAVAIWDEGSYDPLEWEADSIHVTLEGRELRGGFVLVRLKRGKDNEWLLIKRRDEHAVDGWRIRRALTAEKREALEERSPPGTTS
jgi:bifunctional non-homologous end joining protein LigD